MAESGISLSCLKKPKKDLVSVSGYVHLYLKANTLTYKDKAFYTNMTRLMPYVKSAALEGEKTALHHEFLRASVDFLRKCRKDIRKCKAFPSKKEKLSVFFAAYNILLYGKSLRRIVK